MVWAILVLAVIALGFAGTTVAVVIRSGSLGRQRDAWKVACDDALDAQERSSDRVAELSAVVVRRGREIQSLYEELATCGDAESRSRVAIAGIELMLSGSEDDIAEADHH